MIDVDLPVTGSLDDPTFRVGPIIWKVFVNLIEKAEVTADPFPCSAICSAVVTRSISSNLLPAVRRLDATALSRLDSITKALDARPGLGTGRPE